MHKGHNCPYCDEEMEKSNIYKDEFWGMPIEAEYTMECPKCKYKYEYSYGSIETIQESQKEDL